MIESSDKLMADELSKAGTDPVLIEKLKKDRITVDKELPPMEFLLQLFDVPICPRGELVAFTGKAKSDGLIQRKEEKRHVYYSLSRPE